MTVSLTFTIVNTYAPQGAKPATPVERKTPPVQADDSGCEHKRPASRQNRFADAMMSALRELGFGGTAASAGAATATAASAAPATSTPTATPVATGNDGGPIRHRDRNRGGEGVVGQRRVGGAAVRPRAVPGAAPGWRR